ncbi:hypothetical protein ACQPZ2_33120 [Nocardia pseudovaccinii]|uniref:hypothetical protein n=1 Tax=Nocardia pseudovaccinii TaxID=189540 RepID=UPI003D8F05E0
MSGNGLRLWMVTAARIDADRIEALPAGVAVAADLELAAEQVCAHLPTGDPDASGYYLIASAAHATTASRTWVSRVHRQNESAHWILGPWTSAAEAAHGCPAVLDAVPIRKDMR